MVDRAEVDADLVGPAGLQPALEEGQLGRAIEPLEHAVLGARRAPVGDDGHLAADPGAIAPDRGVDDAVRRLGMPPHERDVHAVSAACDANCSISASAACCVRATTSSPELPASSRWTMPGRCSSPTPTRSGYRASRPLTSVPSALPAPGCTTSPAGLSTTMTASSSWTTPNVDRRIGLWQAGLGHRARVDRDLLALGEPELADRCRPHRRRWHRRRR